MSALLRASLAVGVLSFIIFILTQAPGLYYTDVGELAAACKTWGVAHPTGYPLFTLIGHVWTLLPWPSVIKGLNILVALYTAAAAAIMVVVIKSLIGLTFSSLSERSALIVASSTAMLFALGTTVWEQSTALEVYSLNLFFFVVLLHYLLLLYTDKDRFIVHSALSGVTFGFMLANHISSVFLLPGVVWIWWRAADRSLNRVRAIVWLLTPMIIGCTFYVLLPIRSAQLPPINWGMVHRGLPEFIYHVKGTQFGVWMFSDANAFRENATLFTNIVSHDFLWVGWIVAIIGISAMIFRLRPIAIGLLILCAGNLGISLGYAIPDIEPYFLPSIAVIALFFGIGGAWIVKRLKGAAPFFVFVFPLLALALNYQQMDRSKHHAVEAYTKWALTNADQNAIIITHQWDFLCSAAWYLQTVENYRSDVTIVDKELLRRTWYAPYLTQLYPDVMKEVQPSIDAYMPWLKSFEYDRDRFMSESNNATQIQRRFVDVLNAILETNQDRPIYVTPEILQEEQGFAAGYNAAPAGPLIRLTRDTTILLRTKTEHLSDVTASLRGRTTRLDSALTQTILSALYNDAMFTLKNRKDTSEYKLIRNYAISLGPKSRVANALRMEN